MTESPARSALITGTGQRIGRAIALALAAEGWSVAAHYKASGEETESLVAEIRRQGGRAEAVKADLCDEGALAGLFGKARAAVGDIRCLINNAAVFEKDTIATADRASWDHHMQVNLRAPLVLTQDFARSLPDGVSGNVINIIDQRVWNLTPDFVTYTLSKTALWTLTQTAAMALAPRIRVNAIGPGPTLPSIHQTDEQFRRQCEALPLERGAAPEEIAAAVCFLLDASSVTGQMIAVDGGQHLGWSSRAGAGGYDG
ncbi:MAG: SDR family oxidoreductase [Rhodospirillales bacterium]